MNYTLGKKIRLLRKNLKLSQNDVACDILSRSVLSKIETDKVTPSIYQLKYLSTILHVSMDFLLSDDEFNINNTINTEYDRVYNYYNQKLYSNILSLYESNKINCNKNINYYFYIGVSYFNLDFFDKSSKLLRKYIRKVLSLNPDIQTQYSNNFIKSINIISLNYFNNSEVRSAIKYTLIGKNFLENKNLISSDDYLKIINNLGINYIYIFEYKKCINITGKFIDMSKEHINLRYVPRIYLNLNISSYNIGNYDDAIKYIRIAMFFYKYMNNEYEYMECYTNYINCYRYCNNFEKSFEILETFKNNYFDTINDTLIYDFIILEATLYFNIKNFNKASEILSNLNTKKLTTHNKNNINFIKGHIEFLNNNYDKSKYLLNRCKNYLKQRHYFFDLMLVYYDLFIIEKDEKYIIELKELYSRKDIRKNILISSIDIKT